MSSQREVFINKFAMLEDSYVPNENFRVRLEEDALKNNCTTLKEFYIGRFDMFLSKVRLKDIKQITQKAENPFTIFYTLDDEIIKDLFYILSNTENGLHAYHEYAFNWKTLKDKSDKSTGVNNKIDEVISYIIATDPAISKHNDLIGTGAKIDYRNIPQGYKTVEYLIDIKNTIGNKHFTINQLFEDLLYKIYRLLSGKKYIDDNLKSKIISKQKIYNTVNTLISEYFNGLIEFGKDNKLDKYKSIVYTYDGVEINLTHK